MILRSVAFFGCSCGERGDAHIDSAYETAKVVAKSGRKVVNGGGPGVMLASTQGAEDVGGETTVVYFKPELASKFEGREHKNIADETHEESNYILRTKKLLEISDVVIIFNGGTGTISEFAMAWGIARLYIDHHKPLILYGEFWHDLMSSFKKNMLIRPDEQTVYTIVTSPQEVMDVIDSYEIKLQKRDHSHLPCKGPECSLRL